MKWFTRGFAGEVDLGECWRAVEEYQVHLAALLRGASREMREFANVANLRDGVVQRFVVGPEGVEMSVRVGDRTVEMEFGDALATRRALPGGAVILYDELDRIADAYEIRFLLADLSEVSVVFDSLRWVSRTRQV